MATAGAPDDLTARLDYAFAREELLERALTHRSAASSDGAPSYERLEFLGDRVLNLVMADLLLNRFRDESEGDLARRHAVLVSGDSLVRVAQGLELDRFLRVAPGEAGAGTHGRASVLADSLEAILGALYRDGGLEAVAAVIARLWAPLLDEAAAPPQDAKTALQEWAQARARQLPVYETVEAVGPPHEPVFTVEVRVEGLPPARGTAGSKRQAEQIAARAALDIAEREGATDGG